MVAELPTGAERRGPDGTPHCGGTKLRPEAKLGCGWEGAAIATMSEVPVVELLRTLQELMAG